MKRRPSWFEKNIMKPLTYRLQNYIAHLKRYFSEKIAPLLRRILGVCYYPALHTLTYKLLFTSGQDFDFLPYYTSSIVFKFGYQVAIVLFVGKVTNILVEAIYTPSSNSRK